MRVHASAVVSASIFLAAGCAPEDTRAADDGASSCYGGYGLALRVEAAACADPTAPAPDALRIVVTSGGAEHGVDTGFAGPDVALAWPMAFVHGDPARIEVLAYAEEGACTLAGAADVTIDREACTNVTVATACTCAAPSAR